MMPPFGPDQLSGHDLEMVVRCLRNDYPRPGATSASGSIAAVHDRSGTSVVVQP
jgi:hypothetical protein